MRRNEIKKQEFIARLTEVCGTDQPAEIAGKFQISYQAARNYLKGRLPETKILMRISEKTGCSIHWLLTGNGKKFISGTENLHTLPSADQIRRFVREEFVGIFNEIFSSNEDSESSPKETVKQRIVKISSDQIKFEKTADSLKVFSEKQS